MAINLVTANVNGIRSVSVNIIFLRASTAQITDCRVGNASANSARIFENSLVAKMHMAARYFTSSSTMITYFNINKQLLSEAFHSAGKGE